MPKTDAIITNFTAGELSPRLKGRVDHSKYYNGCETLENMLIYPHGGAVRRPGTYFVHPTKDSGVARLIPFQYSTTQAYIIEVGNTYMRFYKDEGIITLTAQDITGITQANPAVLTYSGADTYSNGDRVIITGVVGMTELNGREFTVANVNAGANTFELSGINSSSYTAYSSGGSVAEIYEISTSYATADLFELKYTQSADTMYIVHPTYKPQKLTRSAHTTWTIGNYTPTADPFTSANNYPSCVAFFEERIIFAATNNNPQKLWASVSGDFEDMTVGVADDDAFTYTIAADQVNRIRWLSPQNYLLAGTTGGEWRIGSGTTGDPISPTNISIKRQSTYGSKDVQGLLVNDAVLFIQRAGKKIREFTYSWEKDGYVSPDMTLIAEHITGDGIVQMDYQAQPDSIFWAVTDDGQLIAMTYERDQEVVGWHRHIIGGTSVTAESVAVIPVSTHDEVWVIVSRTINSATVRYVEYFKSADIPTLQRDCFYVDGGLTSDQGAAATITGITNADPCVVTAGSHGFSNGDYVKIKSVVGMTEVNYQVYIVANSAASTFSLQDSNGDDINSTSFGTYTSGGTVEKVVNSISGLNHLEGESVNVLLDGAIPTSSYTVSSGRLSLERYANTIHIGLNYVSDLQPMPITLESRGGISQGKTKRISKITAKFYKTIGAKIGFDADNLDTIPFRDVSDSMDEPVPYFSGDKEMSFPYGHAKEYEILIRQDKPLPMTVLLITTEIEYN